MFEFSPVGINLEIREFTIEKEGRKICFKDETLPTANFLVSHKKMNKILKKGAMGAVVYVQKIQVQQPTAAQPKQLQTLIDKFQVVFSEPATLPPKREFLCNQEPQL
jgi:hypothetical protein